MAQERNQGSDSRHVRDVMTPNPECVSEKDSIRDVARIMRDEDTGVVPVVDGKKVIGLITDRDIVVRGLAEGKDLGNARVNEFMTKQVRSVREDDSVNDALQLMTGAEIRRVPVVNRNDEIVGIVSLGDIASDSGQPGKVGRAVEDISEAPPNN
ncbi:MAG: CBS domain-containing protein [Acidobacteria bacterium]|nr:CBS domain-containing protein [Acidobacteriota bacterium]MBV9476893.1 CBS domain-containing protein [Acidobacteriota bacterium]